MKTVIVRKFGFGFGWDYGDNEARIDPVHKCILARYLNAGVTNPELVMQVHLQQELSGIKEEKIKRFNKAINKFDNAEGDDESLKLIKELAKILKLQVRLVN